MSKIVLGSKYEVKVAAVISDDNEVLTMFLLMGLRTHCPKIWYLGILNILKESEKTAETKSYSILPLRFSPISVPRDSLFLKTKGQ